VGEKKAVSSGGKDCERKGGSERFGAAGESIDRVDMLDPVVIAQEGQKEKVCSAGLIGGGGPA